MHRQKSGSNRSCSPTNKQRNKGNGDKKETNSQKINLPLAYQSRNRSVSPENSKSRKESEVTESKKSKAKSITEKNSDKSFPSETNPQKSNLPLVYQRRNGSESPENTNSKEVSKISETRESYVKTKARANSTISLCSEENLQDDIQRSQANQCIKSLRNNSNSYRIEREFHSSSKQTFVGGSKQKQTGTDSHDSSSTKYNNKLVSSMSPKYTMTRNYPTIVPDKRIPGNKFLHGDFSRATGSGGNQTTKGHKRRRSRSRSRSIERQKTKNNSDKAKSLQIPLSRTPFVSKGVQRSRHRGDPLDFLFSQKIRRSDKTDTPGLLMDLMFSKNALPSTSQQNHHLSNAFNVSSISDQSTSNQYYGNQF